MLRITIQLVVALTITTLIGCAHKTILSTTTDLASVSFDPRLPTQPKRFWRLIVKWEPYLLDDKKALLHKEFQLVVREPAERQKLENEIRSRGGDARYLRWLESELAPIGTWERRTEAHVSRLKNETVVVLLFKAAKEVTRSGYLTVHPVYFPDPILEATVRGCGALDWGVLSSGDSVGVEIVFLSRHDDPGSAKWDTVQRESNGFAWKAWSTAHAKAVFYDATILVKNNISRCPLPPKVDDEYRLFHKALAREMGIDW